MPPRGLKSKVRREMLSNFFTENNLDILSIQEINISSMDLGSGLEIIINFNPEGQGTALIYKTKQFKKLSHIGRGSNNKSRVRKFHGY